MNSQPVFVGVDVGASRTKVVALNPEKKLIGHAVRKSGTDFGHTASLCLESALNMANAAEKDIVSLVYFTENSWKFGVLFRQPPFFF